METIQRFATGEAGEEDRDAIPYPRGLTLSVPPLLGSASSRIDTCGADGDRLQLVLSEPVLPAPEWIAMSGANRPRTADRKDRCIEETLRRYRGRGLATRYKSEYTAGLTPLHLRSRIIAAGEIAVVAQLLREMDTAGSALLDVPCGAGKLGRVLQSFPVHVIAADASRDMLALARTEYDPVQLLCLLECDARALPFKDAAFDIVACLRLLHRLPPEPRRMVLEECRRVTRRELIVSYGYHSTFQRIRRAARVLYAGGVDSPFPVPLAEVFGEIEAAGFRPRKWRRVLPVLSGEIIVRASV